MSDRGQRAFTTLCLALTLASLACLAGCKTTPVESATRQHKLPLERARPADDLVDSIGVNIHLGYTDTAYKSFDEVVRPRLEQLGIRHLRDGVAAGSSDGPRSSFYRRVRALARTGARFDLITSMDTSFGSATDMAALPAVQKWAGGAVESFEGVNEPDIQGVPDWVSAVRASQARLFSTVRSSPLLSDVSVIAPSPTTPEAASELGDLSEWSDFGNMHNYLTDRMPETSGWGSDGYGSLRWNMDRVAAVTAPRLPVMSTETGWSTSPTSGAGLSESVAGTYATRQVLNSFDAGVVRTYVYELLRERADPDDQESNYGLVRADGTVTPAFNALESLTSLLSDPGPKQAPGDLAWSISGDTADVRHVLVEKRDGTFYLILWVGKSGWDPDRDRVLDVAEQAVQLHVTTPSSVKSVQQQAPDGHLQPLRSATDLRVGASPVFVEISPG